MTYLKPPEVPPSPQGGVHARVPVTWGRAPAARSTQLRAWLLACVLATGLAGCGEICTNAPVTSVPSPSGKNKAVVFHRTCGKTTQVNTQVAVIPSYSDLSNIPGNTLILTGDVPLDVRWTSETALSISGQGTAKVSRQESEVAGISIEYHD